MRGARQDRFYERRMAKSKGQQKAADRRQLEQEIHLVKAPGALAREKEQKLKGELLLLLLLLLLLCVCVCVCV